MRRSAAPSVVQSSKKLHFQPPFATQPTPSSKTVPTGTEGGKSRPRLTELQQALNGIRHPPRSTEPSSTSEATPPVPLLCGPRLVPSTVESNVLKELCSSDSGPESSMPKGGTSSSQTTASISSEGCDSQSDSASVCNANPRSGVSGTTPAARIGYRAPHRSGFCPPAKRRRPNGSVEAPCTSSSSANEAVKSNSSSLDVGCKYYSVMWCKLSKKKHKTWEGDAILITKGRTVVLKDMEGKDIGRGTGYKPSELADMKDGSTLVVGGKEIEVMAEVMAEVGTEEWMSGKCFTGASTDSVQQSVSEIQPVKLHKKGFSNPSHSGSAGTAMLMNAASQATVEPLHNPTALDALVMPRPGQRHQLQHNRGGLPVVDVVVDPHLSSCLRHHQREGVRFLYECIMGLRDFSGSGAILADEMGLGKTLQCITTLWTLIKQGPYGRKPVVRRAIIITPGSLVKNWEREFCKWLGSERLRVFAVAADNRVEEFAKSPIYPVLIISYEMFLRSHDALKGLPFDLLVCDEGHRLKNGGAKTTSLLMGMPVRRRIVLTGTPIQNDLHEFYSIVEFCNPGILGSHAAFQRVYEDPIVLSRQPTATPEEKEVGETRAHELKRLTSLFCLRRTQEINNEYLPPKVESVIFCKMAPLQLALYHHLLESGLVQSCLRRNSNFSPHLVCIGALKKLCNCPSLIHSASTKAMEVEGGGEGQEDVEEVDPSLYAGVLPLYPACYDPLTCNIEHSGKLTVLSKMLEYLHTSTREKIVVVSNYTQTLNLLQQLCEVAGYSFLRLDGSTPAAKRQPIVERFNSKYCSESVFLLSSKAGGVGLNLIGASRLVLYDIDWNPANDLQAMARVWRDGQRRRVHIYRLLTTGSIEEKIYQRQICKQGLNTVVDVKDRCDSGLVLFSLEDLRDLFSLRDGTLCDTHDLLECNCEMLESHSDVGLRPCQLGQPVSSRNTAMHELLDWKHFRCPIEQSELQDELLHSAASNITFVFQSEANSPTV